MRGFPGRAKHSGSGDPGFLAAVSEGDKGFPGVSGCFPPGRLCECGRFLDGGRQERALLEWCWAGLAAAPRVPGESPTPGWRLIGLLLRRPGFSWVRGTEGKNRGIPFQGDPSLGDPHFRGGKDHSASSLSFLDVTVFRQRQHRQQSSFVGFIGGRDERPSGGDGGDSLHLHLYTNSPSPKPPAGSGREMAAVRLLLRLLLF